VPFLLLKALPCDFLNLLKDFSLYTRIPHIPDEMVMLTRPWVCPTKYKYLIWTYDDGI
jgi:hypothetical protein